MLALALMLMLEGLMPLFFPALWRQCFERLLSFSDGQLRFIGLASFVAGLLLFSLFY